MGDGRHRYVKKAEAFASIVGGTADFHTNYVNSSPTEKRSVEGLFFLIHQKESAEPGMQNAEKMKKPPRRFSSTILHS